jgi:hypothetical protein
MKPVVQWFVRAGTDRESVVSIGLLRESLRGPREFGCPGPPSQSNSQANRVKAPNHVRARGVAARHLQRHPEGCHRPATPPSSTALKSYYVTGDRTRGRPAAALPLEARRRGVARVADIGSAILIRSALYLASYLASSPALPCPMRPRCLVFRETRDPAWPSRSAYPPLRNWWPQTDTRLRRLRVEIDI